MSSRSFQSIKSELADLDEHYLAELINLGDRQVQEKPPITAATETELIDRETAEDFLNLARLGLWVVQREQQSRRN